MNNEQNKEEVIDLREVWASIVKRKKWFFIAWPITFVVSALIIVCVPRTYTTSTVLAPEMNIPTSGGTLGALASNFGIDLGDRNSTDAIYPSLYPDLMDDNGFVYNLFDIRVKSADGAIDTTLYAYKRYFTQYPWWTVAVAKLKNLLPKTSDGQGTKGVANKAFNPYQLSKNDDAIMGAIRKSIAISVDKKNDVITISTEAQDPLICKTIADSVRQRLQEFITAYRTKKARNDVEYYAKLTADAKVDYERVRQTYGAYADANMDVILQSYKSKTEDLENDMQLKYNTYTSLQAQLQAARAKLRENTPAFTLLKGAAVPVKATGPKRMFFVIGMLFLITFALICFCTKEVVFPKKTKRTDKE